MDKFKKSSSQANLAKKFANNTIRIKQSTRPEDDAITAEGPMQESYLDQNARSILQAPMQLDEQRVIKKEISNHFDNQASNPVHVNNVKSLFGLEGSVLGDLRAAKFNKEPTLAVIPSENSSLKSIEDLDKEEKENDD